MAAVSASQSQNSRVDNVTWNFSVPVQIEKTIQSQSPDSPSRKPYNDALTHQVTKPNVLLQKPDSHISMRSTDNALFPSVRTTASNRKDSSISDTGSAADSLLDLYGPNQSSINSVDLQNRLAPNGMALRDNEGSENSRWIHRDKLAQIESQELQAAGIVLPRSRAPSKTSGRREPSKDLQANNTMRVNSIQKQQWNDSLPSEEEEAPENSSWDLRLPDEVAAEDSITDVSGGVKSMSRIPVNKKSPLPIPMAHLERDTILLRKKSDHWLGEEEGISNTKVREQSENAKDLLNATHPFSKRAASENLTVKRPGVQTRSVSNNRETTQRPSTRSGLNVPSTSSRPVENGQAASKRPEGDPPWLSSMYKPDPRLPPDQQLLPTIAKRLQQEQWEKEGKFGNTYDTSFRPLNDHSPASRPIPPPIQITSPKDQNNDEWPLQSPKSSSMNSGRPGTAGGYSTMPKIIEPPPVTTILAEPKLSVKEPEPLKVEENKRCGCCLIM